MLAGSLGKGDVPNVRTERHKERQNTQYTTTTCTRRHARQRQLQQLERQRRLVQRHVGTRRRGTVAAGRYEHVSMPRTTARYGRDGTRPGSRRRPLDLRAVTSNSGCSGRWRRRHVSTRRSPSNGCTANGLKLCRTSLRAQIVSTP